MLKWLKTLFKAKPIHKRVVATYKECKCPTNVYCPFTSCLRHSCKYYREYPKVIKVVEK